MAHVDLGVCLAANTVESSGKKISLSLGLAPSPDSAIKLDDNHSPARSPTPWRHGMEPGRVQLPAKHCYCCAWMLGEVSKPEAWTQGGTLHLPAIAGMLMVGQAAGSRGLGAHGCCESLARERLLEQRRRLQQLLSLARKRSAAFRPCQ